MTKAKTKGERRKDMHRKTKHAQQLGTRRMDEIVLQYAHPTNSDRWQSKLDGITPRTINFVLQNRLARSTKHSPDSLCP